MYNLHIFITFLVIVFGSLSAYSASLTNFDYWVSIGDPGNTGDTNPVAIPANCGKVDYVYEIMKFEVTVTQYNECPVNLLFTNGIPDSNYEPVRFVTFFKGMNYADWLTTNVPVVFTNNYLVYTNGATNASCWLTNTFINYLKGGYTQSTITSLIAHAAFTNWMNYVHMLPYPENDVSVTSIVSGSWFRLPGSTNHVYLIPTEDEWYKAAYGSVGGGYFRYPHASANSPTTNEFNYGGWFNEICAVSSRTGVSSYGAYDMGGNVWEWIEPNTNPPAVPSGTSIIRGGSYFSSDPRGLSVETREYHAASNAVKGIGFRMVRIPIPQP